MSDWSPPRRDPFVELTDDAAHAAAVRARTEERALRDRAAELASWVGTLRDLAERGTPVTILSRSGRTHRGVLVGVAEDHVATRLPGGQLVAIAAHALSSVRPEPGASPTVAMGDRERAQDRTLLEVVDRVAAERRRVAVSIEGSDDVLQGTLASVGEDIVTLQLDSHDRAMVYVRAAALLEVVIEPTRD